MNRIDVASEKGFSGKEDAINEKSHFPFRKTTLSYQLC